MDVSRPPLGAIFFHFSVNISFSFHHPSCALTIPIVSAVSRPQDNCVRHPNDMFLSVSLTIFGTSGKVKGKEEFSQGIPVVLPPCLLRCALLRKKGAIDDVCADGGRWNLGGGVCDIDEPPSRPSITKVRKNLRRLGGSGRRPTRRWVASSTDSRCKRLVRLSMASARRRRKRIRQLPVAQVASRATAS